MFPCKFSDQAVPIIHDARNDIFVAGRIKADTFSTGSGKEETGKYRKEFPETGRSGRIWEGRWLVLALAITHV
jgi:hypothetical protein